MADPFITTAATQSSPALVCVLCVSVGLFIGNMNHKKGLECGRLQLDDGMFLYAVVINAVVNGG